MTRPHLLILDAQSLAARAASVIAIPARGGAPSGPPTDTEEAGFLLWCQMVRGAARDIEATHLVAAWDPDGPTFRHALFPDYKKSRTGSMRAKVTPIRERAIAAGVPSVMIPEFEGDDCVSSLLHRFRQEARMTLLSNDTDLLQWLSEEVGVATYASKGQGTDGKRVRLWTRADVVERFGVPPEQLTEYKALAGESGDDIPGAVGIGKGKALELLRRWKTVAGALDASTFVSHKDATAKLAGQEEHMALMLRLTQLRIDAPLPPLALEHLALTQIRWPDTGTPEVRRGGHAGPGLDSAVPFPEERTGR